MSDPVIAAIIGASGFVLAALIGVVLRKVGVVHDLVNSRAAQQDRVIEILTAANEELEKSNAALREAATIIAAAVQGRSATPPPEV